MKKKIAVMTSTIVAINSMSGVTIFAENSSVYPSKEMLVEPDKFMAIKSNWNGENVIKDPVLRFMINSRYNRKGSEKELSEMNVTKEMVENLVVLSPEQCKAHNSSEIDFMVKDLTGLEYAKNLEWLSLVNQKETSISSISGCKKLKHLDLRNNDGITDLSPISALSELVELDIRSVKTKNLDILKNMKNLKSLVAFSCGIENIDGLKELTNLEYLELEFNPFTNINALSELVNLKYLDISKSQKYDYVKNQALPAIDSIDALSKLVNLKSFSFTSNNVKNINVLKNMKKLKDLYCSNNNISDWSALDDMNVDVKSMGNPVEYIKKEIPPVNNENPVEETLYQMHEVINPHDIKARDKVDGEMKLPKTVSIRVNKKDKNFKFENGIYNKSTIRYMVKDEEGNIVNKSLKFNAIPIDKNQIGIYDVFSKDGYLDFKTKDVVTPNKMNISLMSDDYDLVGSYSITEETCQKGFYIKSISTNEKTLSPDDIRPENSTTFTIPEDKKDIFVITVKKKPQAETNQYIGKKEIVYVVKDEKGNIVKDKLNFKLTTEDDNVEAPHKSTLLDGYYTIKIDGTDRNVSISLIDENYSLVGTYKYKERYNPNKGAIITSIEKSGKTVDLENKVRDKDDKYILSKEEKEYLVLVVKSKNEITPSSLTAISSTSSVDNKLLSTRNESITTENSNINNKKDLSKEQIDNIPVKWVIDNDKSTENKLIYTGIVTLPENIENPHGITAKAIINIEKKSDQGTDSSGGISSDNKISSSNNQILLNKKDKNIVSVSGIDRIETSLELSKKYYKEADNVILVNGFNYPDALVSSSLSAKLKAPIILTNGKQIPKSILDELKRLKAKNIVIVGGLSSINQDIQEQMEKKYSVKRLSGLDRYETANAIFDYLKYLGADNTNVILSSGENYPDALSAGNISTVNFTPILLTKKDAISENTRSRISSNEIKKVIIVGGNSSISDMATNGVNKDIVRLSGLDRYETSVKVAKYQYPSSNKVFVASGEVYADALSTNGVLGVEKSPLVLTMKNSISNSAKNYIEKSKEIVLIGGSNSINSNILK